MTGQPARELIYYDGTCGLCHRAVRFVISKDRDGSLFHFAPLQGETLKERFDAKTRLSLPDSIVIETTTGMLLTRSRAVLYILERLGGVWRLLARVARVVPLALADGLYDVVATIRSRLFSRPAEACPVVPDELRSRFMP